MPEMRMITREFIWRDCGECGVHFAMPALLDGECRATGRAWFCPNGHSRIYSQTDTDTLQTLRVDLAQAIVARDAAEAKLARVKNGVCPECKRTFGDLHRHMKTKHGKS